MVSSDIPWNADADRGEYWPPAAHSKAAARQQRSGGRKLVWPRGCGTLSKLLPKRWSPQQISEVLPGEILDQRPGMSTSRRSIQCYAWVATV